MKGTDKQITWSKEIQETVTKVYDNAIAEIAKSPSNPRNEAVLADLNKRKNLVIDAEYAGDIIDLFKDIRYTGDFRMDFPKLKAVYTVSAPETDGQRKILCK